jgi:CheY-like chemotaxis protein
MHYCSTVVLIYSCYHRIGPRKLARALFLAYTRWMNFSDSPTRSYATPSSVKRPDSLHRTQSSFTITNTSRPAGGRVSSYSHSASSSPTDYDDTSVFSDVKDETSVNSTTPDEPSTSEPPDTFTKFLLVDDNHINLKVLSTYLKKLGVEYDLAMNGKEAVDLFCLSYRTYTCVLMDISMPVMDGFEATRYIRAHEVREDQHRVPIIALSGLASEDAHREAIGSGMDLLLTKPVKLKALGSLLSSMGIINV